MSTLLVSFQLADALLHNRRMCRCCFQEQNKRLKEIGWKEVSPELREALSSLKPQGSQTYLLEMALC